MPRGGSVGRRGEATGDLGAQIAAWFREARRTPKGQSYETEEAFYTAANVPRNTYYRMLERPDKATQPTLDKIAKACGVQPPSIVRTLRASDVPADRPRTVAWLIQEAEALLREARARLEVKHATPDAAQVARDHREILAGAPRKARPSSPKGRTA